MIRSIAFVLGLTLTSAAYAQEYAPGCYDYWGTQIPCDGIHTPGEIPTRGLSLAAIPAGAQDASRYDALVQQMFDNGDKAAWWQSCALSRKCSDWVRSGLPYPPTTPQDGLDCTAGPAGYLVCQDGNRTITCKERSDCAAIASAPSDSSWHIQIRRGGLTHDNCEDIKRGAEAEGATAECFQ